MLRLLISGLILIILGALGFGLYLYQTGVLIPPPKVASHEPDRMLTPAFEEQLVYFLVTKLNIFEGNFEVIDVVNLAVGNFTGNDYVLITLRAPDGKICQVTASRRVGQGGQWQFDDRSFNVIGLAKYEPASVESDYERINALSLGLGKNSSLKDRGLPLGALTRGEEEKLLVFEKLPPALSVEVNKNKKIGYSNQMSADTGSASLWRPDYPTGYLGAGYRNYLYQKVKGEK